MIARRTEGLRRRTIDAYEEIASVRHQVGQLGLSASTLGPNLDPAAISADQTPQSPDNPDQGGENE